MSPRGVTENRVDVFRPLVHIGTDLKANHKASLTGYPISKGQEAMTWIVYATQEFTAQLCNDPGCSRLGSVTVPCNDTDGVKVELEFGATEIIVLGTNQRTGKSARTTISFE